MKKFYLCLLLTALCFNGFSQAKLDSLKKVLAKLPPEGRSFAGDTMRVRVLCEMGEGHFESNFENSLNYYREALKISEKVKFNKGLMVSNFQIGLLYRKKSLHLNASDYLFKSLFYAENLKNNERIGYILRKIGDNYNTLESYDKSIEYYYKALPFEKKYGTHYRYLICLNNIGTSYFGKKDYHQAIKILLICKSNNNPLDSTVACYYHTNLGFAFQELGDYKNAIKNYSMCYLYMPNNESIIAFANAGIAEALFKQKKYKEALQFASKSKVVLQKIDEPTLPLRVYKTLFQVYKALENPKMSLFFYEKYSEYKFSEDSLKSVKLLQSLNFIYENEKQQQRILELNSNLENEERIKQGVIYSLILLVLVFILVLYSYNFIRKKNNEIQRSNEELLITKNELIFLNNSLEIKVNERTAEIETKNQQIKDALFDGQVVERERIASHIHDNIGSTISALKWRLEALRRDDFNAQEEKIFNDTIAVVKNIYDDVRSLSHNLVPDILKKQGLVGAISKVLNDLSINKVKFDFRQNIKSEIDKKIELELFSIFLETLNNILKYSKATEVKINLLENRKDFSLKIQDNGVGFNLSKSDGNGLKNITKRVNSLDGKVDIDSFEGMGTKIEVTIPKPILI
ncbi:MAG: tetratricopeptide repeat protein [Arcicella sp.]|jgi:signal transduction histidine kinase|nr:tetratricopeptide repeat protein [Arcicella sp.]